ncbi:MAG: TRAP transporter substrate-binding protein DctP [Desulfobacter sp.]
MKKKNLKQLAGPAGSLRAGFVIVMLLLAAVAVVPGNVLAKGRDIKLSYNGPPDENENAVHRFAADFKARVESNTGGKLTVSLYPNSQLGNEEQRMEQVMSGPMITISSYAGIAPVFPEMFAANIPFMFDSYAAAHLFFDNSEFWSRAKAAFKERTGAVILEAVEEGGFLAFTNSKRKIQSPKDFKGLKFRAMDVSQVALYKAFGASAAPIPWTEVYMALKTGIADGQMNPPMYIIMGSLYEVQTHMCMANIQYSDQFMVVNGDWLAGLSPDLKAVVTEAARAANAANRKSIGSQVADRVAFIKSKGVAVYYPDAGEMAAFRELGQPAFVEWLKTRMDGSWVELAMDSAAKANAAAGQ